MAAYPAIASDYERTFQVLTALPVDIFLGAHGGYFDLQSKYVRLQAGEGKAFIDPEGYRRYVADRESAFRRELGRQKAVRSG